MPLAPLSTLPHGAVNERAWREVMRWERANGGADACGGPRLLKLRCARRRGALPCRARLAGSAVDVGYGAQAQVQVPAVMQPVLCACLFACLPACLPAGGGRRTTLPRRACSTCWATSCPLTATTGSSIAAARKCGASAAVAASPTAVCVWRRGGGGGAYGWVLVDGRWWHRAHEGLIGPSLLPQHWLAAHAGT